MTVTYTGIGPVRAGMTVADARAAIRTLTFLPNADTTGCAYATSTALPQRVTFLIENGVVGRVNVDTSSVTTTEGATIGDTEDRVKSLYGSRVAVTPHKYTDGHYLTVASPTDTTYRIIFETQNGRVTRYRAGRMPQVAYVEGCG